MLEMYSETWLPERLISERWVSSRFSILLNWEGDTWGGGREGPPITPHRWFCPRSPIPSARTTPQPRGWVLEGDKQAEGG